jgi:hypothetical protein
MYVPEKGLSYQMVVLIVQGKLDCPVFTGLTPWKELTPSPILSHLIPDLSRTTMRVTPRTPLSIPWFLCGTLEFLSEIISPRTSVSDYPTSFPPSQGILHKSSICLLHGWICNSFGTLALFMS